MLYECLIRFIDDNSENTVIIKDSLDVIDNEDDDIFFYCNSEKDIKSLMFEDNGEDFVVIGYKPLID